MVPETLLKKRKQNEKATELKAQQTKEKREAVSTYVFIYLAFLVMIPTIYTTRLRPVLSLSYTIFRV